jgi:hypothetical protein
MLKVVPVKIIVSKRNILVPYYQTKLLIAVVFVVQVTVDVDV